MYFNLFSVIPEKPKFLLFESATLGEELHGREFALKLYVLSSSEFGTITSIDLFYGEIQTKSEELIMTYNYTSKKLSVNYKIGIESRSCFYYIRGILTTRKKTSHGHCITNPVWFREQNA